MNILVTGSSGFIGTNLAHVLESVGHTLIPYDKADDAELDTALKLKLEDIIHFNDVDAIVHLAAVAGVGTCEEWPTAALEANVNDLSTVLECAEAELVQRVVFASSQAAGCPVNVYGATKALGEQLVRCYSERRGLSGVSLRFSNVFGPHSMHKTSVIHSWCRSYFSNQPLTVFDGGEQTRDFVYVKDVCRAIVRAVEEPTYHGEVYSVSFGKQSSINTLFNLFCDVAGRTVERKDLDSGLRNGDQTIPAERLPMWTPRIDLWNGLADTFYWYEGEKK